MHRSRATLLHSPISIKTWLAQIPSVDVVRPSHCPHCQSASRPPGQPLRLVGHGLTRRQVRAVLEEGGPARLAALALRRFLCRACQRTCTVAPADVLVRRLFCRTALVLALTFWAVLGQPASEVRRTLSDQSTFDGDDWPQLRRWSRSAASGALFGTPSVPAAAPPRSLAAAVVGHLRALAPAFVQGLGAVAEALAGARRRR